MNKYKQDAYDRIALELAQSLYKGFKIIQIGVGYKVVSLNGFTQSHWATIAECKKSIDALLRSSVRNINNKPCITK